jgi:hypothetical protein
MEFDTIVELHLRLAFDSIGIFTHAGAVGRRQIIRRIFEPDLHPEGYRIDYKFIVGRPPDDDWRYLLDNEQSVSSPSPWCDS